MRHGRLEEQAADSLLAGEPTGHAGAAFARSGALLRALRDVPPLPAESVDEPFVARMASIVKESAPVAVSQRLRTADAFSGRIQAPVRRTFFRTRLVVGLTAAILLVGGGLAFAGALPAPLQDTASHVLHRIGLHVPEHVTHPAARPPVPLPGAHGRTHAGRGGRVTPRPSGSTSGGEAKHAGSGGQDNQGQQGGEGASGGDGSGSSGNQSGGEGSGTSGDSGNQGGQGAGNGSGGDQGSNT